MKELVYKTIGDAELKLHVFEPEARAGRAPAIVLFFGGGWQGGTPSQFYPHCEHFASRGLVAISAEYRVASVHGTSPFECVADGKSAVRWIRSHADELGIDPARIVAGGGSAGGHVAACTGTIPGFDEGGEDTGVSSRPNAMILFNPVIDTTQAGFGSQYLGDRCLEISPVHHVDATTPPSIIFHGTADITVPFENVERFARLVQQAGGRCELVAFERMVHAFFNYGQHDNVPFNETIAASDRFLTSLGFEVRT